MYSRLKHINRHQQNLIDATGNKTTFLYDALGRLSQQIDPRGFGVTYAYDAVSRLVSRTDRDGRRIDTGYDSVGNKTSENWVASNGSTVDQRLTFTYDANNQQLTAANGAGTYTMVRDALGRVTSEQDVWGLRMTFTYDALSRRTVVTDSLGGVTTSTFDYGGNLTRRDFGGSGQTPLRVDQTFDALNRVTAATRYQDLAGVYPGAIDSYSYDAAGQMTHLQHLNGSNSSNIANVTTTFDAAGRPTTETRNGVAVTYTYDAANQVTADGVNTVTYDATGNRNNGSNTATTGNRLSTDGVWNYSYDDEGNETKKVRISDGVTWTYGYDQANHLKHAERRTTDGGTLELSADYKYDAWGNRVEKSVDDDGAGPHSATVSRFAYDGWNSAKPSPIGTENFDVWADLDGSSSLTTRYLRSDKVDELFARTEANGDAYWYLADRLGSVRDVTDIGGYLKDSLSYDAFGNITSETNPQYRGRYAWTSREIDVETGLQYNRARYYDATTGRWISQDPMGFDAGDSNLFRYVKNGTAYQFDPSGMENRSIEIYYTEIASQQNRVFVNKGVRAKVDRIIQAALTAYGKGDTITLTWINTPEINLDAMVKYDSDRKDGKRFFGFVKSVSSSNLNFLWVPIPNSPVATTGVGIHSILYPIQAPLTYPFLMLGGLFGSVENNFENGKTVRLSLQQVDKSTRGGLDTYGSGGDFGGVLFAHDVNFEIGKGNAAPVIPRALFDDFVAMVISHEVFYHGLVRSGHYNDPGGPFVDDARFTPATDGPKLGTMVFGPSAANGILKKLRLL